MIINRYIQRNIYLGTFAALMVLVSLGLFFQFVRELDDIGKGSYDFALMLWYVVLRAPNYMVDFLPLSALIGSILSLGALAGNSEVIAMQASGISLKRILGAVSQAAVVLALLGFAMTEWVVPDSEFSARNLKSQAREQTAALRSGQGLWIKDESRVIRITALLPQGYASGVEIYQLDDEGRLRATFKARSAVPSDAGWELHDVVQTTIGNQRSSVQTFDRVLYEGNLSQEVLRVMSIDPRKMSSTDLRAYLKFIEENRLDAKVERLVLWQKFFAPVTVVVMCLLAVPFVLGAQRQSNTGQRLMLGILLGLAFGVVDRLMTQVGTQYPIYPMLAAASPNVIFIAIAVYLYAKKQSHRAGIGLFFRAQ